VAITGKKRKEKEEKEKKSSQQKKKLPYSTPSLLRHKSNFMMNLINTTLFERTLALK